MKLHIPYTEGRLKVTIFLQIMSLGKVLWTHRTTHTNYAWIIKEKLLNWFWKEYGVEGIPESRNSLHKRTELYANMVSYVHTYPSFSHTAAHCHGAL